MLALFVLTALMVQPVEGAEKHDWCNSGLVSKADLPWSSLKPNLVWPVTKKHLTTALFKLSKRGHLRISISLASELTGQTISKQSGAVLYLARAGIVGGPGVSIHDYLRNRDGAVKFFADLNADRKKLLIVTSELSPSFPSRKFAVVVSGTPGIVSSASRCLTAQ